jgi:hypothetical protein
MPMTKPTSEQVTFLAAGSGATQRTALEKLRDVVSVKDFGAVGDGVADDTAAIQTAINTCFGVGGLEPDALVFPTGIYKVMSPITWNRPVRLVGSCKNGAVLKAGAAMNAVIQGSTTIGDTNLTSRSLFDGININGNSLAQRGINGVTNHSTFTGLWVYGTLSAALEIGYGWCNLFFNVECSFNSGDGMILYNEANQNLVQSCKLFDNSGSGVVISGSRAVRITNTVIEANRKTGVYIQYGVTGFAIDTCYFESNAQDGVTFTVPATFTIRADIICNGSAVQTQLATAFPSTGSIVNNYVSSTYTDSFVVPNGLTDARISNNCATGAVIPTVEYYGNPSGSSTSLSYGLPQTTVVGPNTGMTDDILIDPAGVNCYSVGDATTACRNNAPNTANIAVTDLNTWSNVSSGSGGSFVRSSSVFPGNTLVPVWELQASAGVFTTHVFGFSLNAATHSLYHNKWMLFGVWVKAPYVSGVNDGVVQLMANSSVDTQSIWTRGTDWVRVVGLFKMPTTGSLLFGIRTTTQAGTGASNVLVAAPVLCLLGADFQSLSGNFVDTTSFLGTAAPTTGTWKRGDIVVNTTPSAGGTPGWVCTTAGTPGTWKAMANVAP